MGWSRFAVELQDAQLVVWLWEQQAEMSWSYFAVELQDPWLVVS